MRVLKKLANRTRAKLALDATASIGLEKKHQLADAVTFSSCKGLFGLTGGAFIAYKQKPKNKINSFYLNYKNHYNKKMTGPYHILQSLDVVLKNYNKLRKSVVVNKVSFKKI